MADKQGPYKRPPITEAVIDLRVLPTDVPPVGLANIQSQLPAGYSPPADLHFDTFALQAGAGALSTHASREHIGYRFDRTDGQRVLQATVGGFTTSAKAPYDGWERFSAEARELWTLYKRVVKAETVTRIAVRYINQIDLPLPPNDLSGIFRIEDYLATYPLISDRLVHSAYSGMFMQVEIPQPDIQSVLRINQAIVDSPSPEVLSILLDLDLFRNGEWTATDDAPIWDVLNALRKRKNEAFEASITDEARRLFR